MTPGRLARCGLFSLVAAISLFGVGWGWNYLIGRYGSPQMPAMAREYDSQTERNFNGRAERDERRVREERRPREERGQDLSFGSVRNSSIITGSPMGGVLINASSTYCISLGVITNGEVTYYHRVTETPDGINEITIIPDSTRYNSIFGDTGNCEKSLLDWLLEEPFKPIKAGVARGIKSNKGVSANNYSDAAHSQPSGRVSDSNESVLYWLFEPLGMEGS
jgi:hypothetical protein